MGILQVLMAGGPYGPDGELAIYMWGAGGGSGDNGPHNQARNYGAPGGAISLTSTPYDDLNISSGDTLYIYVGGGGQGVDGNNSGGPNGGHPGGGGPGVPVSDSGGGGGMTAIYRNNPHSSGTTNLYLIAGGGGGSAAGNGFAAGGYPQGVGGGPPSHYPNSFPPTISPWYNMQPVGGGGSQNAGGPGGYPTSGYGGAPGGNSGSQFQGGGGPTGDAGGGGAGYYGGGQGRGDAGTVSGSGGGGGSNYQHPDIPGPSITHHDLTTDPNYSPLFSPGSPPVSSNAASGVALNAGSPHYTGSYGRGGNTTNPGTGGPGYVVIIGPTGTSTFTASPGAEQTYSVP